MSFVKDNDAYEAWLARHCDVGRGRHQGTTQAQDDGKARSLFLRATYFRWAGKIGSLVSGIDGCAPEVLAVGDLHLENFGTWRDEDGRLVWGVNDFDEAATMPYTLDLVRLVTSIQLASGATTTSTTRQAAKAVLKGYREGLGRPATGVAVRRRDLALAPCLAGPRASLRISGRRSMSIPRPSHRRRRESQAGADREHAGGTVDEDSIRLCTPAAQGQRQPGTAALCRGRLLARRAYFARGQGAGALGVDLGQWHQENPRSRISSRQTKGRYRAPDPLLHVRQQVRFPAHRRRCRENRARQKGRRRYFTSGFLRPGFDLASVHAASLRGAGAIGKDLDKRPPRWLNDAAVAAAAEVRRDFREWNKYMQRR